MLPLEDDMPVTFDDERMVSDGAYLFRPIRSDETLAEYRKAFANDQDREDPVQAHEIRTGKPWDEWTNDQFFDLVTRHPELITTNPMVLTRMMRGHRV